jgi:hypothetical protein
VAEEYLAAVQRRRVLDRLQLALCWLFVGVVVGIVVLAFVGSP